MEFDPIFSEADIHHTLAILLKEENVGNVHIEFPLPTNPNELWMQVERFRKVSFKREYYRADVCIIQELEPKLIAEIRWMPALYLPIAFSKRWKLFPEHDIERAEEKLAEYRRLNNIAMPDWYMNKLLRNIGKFLDILRGYENIQGYFCILDELCPSINKQLNDKIKEFDIPTNFRILASYIE